MIIKNARVVSETGTSQLDVLFDAENGIIERVAGSIESIGHEVYDASGLFLLPGVIDAHVHLRDPGFTEKEDFFSGTTAAIAGGVTTVIDMPNTNPPTSSADGLKQKLAESSSKAVCDYGVFFGATDSNAPESLELAGLVAGKKIFFGGTTNASAISLSSIESHFKYPKPVLVHAEDQATIDQNEAKYRSMGDAADFTIHNKIRPPQAASAAVGQAIAVAARTKAHLHVCHVSTAGELDLIRAARAEGVNVSCEATPHHLFFDVESASKLGNLMKVNPPIRDSADVAALWSAVLDGTIDLIATDHAPHLKSEKSLGYWSAPSGVPGLETSLPLMLDAVSKGRLSLERVVSLMCATPARKFGLRFKGRVATGFDADFTLVDLSGVTRVDGQELQTKCGWSPFEGMVLNGAIKAVFLRGRLVKEGGLVVAKAGTGKNLFTQ